MTDPVLLECPYCFRDGACVKIIEYGSHWLVVCICGARGPSCPGKADCANHWNQVAKSSRTEATIEDAQRDWP